MELIVSVDLKLQKFTHQKCGTKNLGPQKFRLDALFG